MKCIYCGNRMGKRLMPSGRHGWTEESFCPVCGAVVKGKHVNISSHKKIPLRGQLKQLLKKAAAHEHKDRKGKQHKPGDVTFKKV